MPEFHLGRRTTDGGLWSCSVLRGDHLYCSVTNQLTEQDALLRGNAIVDAMNASVTKPAPERRAAVIFTEESETSQNTSTTSVIGVMAQEIGEDMVEFLSRVRKGEEVLKSRTFKDGSPYHRGFSSNAEALLAEPFILD